VSTFRLTHSLHPVTDCASCASCETSAVSTARVTGSVSSRYTHRSTGARMDEHSATVTRVTNV